MYRPNSTVFAASLSLLCALSGCGGSLHQADSAPGLPDNAHGDARFTSAPEAVHMASALHASGADAEALAVIAAAYRRFPNDATVISAYGRFAAINGQDELAKRLLREALAMSPEDWRAVSAGGVLAAHADRHDDARRAFTHAREMSGNDGVALNNLAVSLILDGNAPEAERLLRQALASPALKDRHRQRVRRNLAVALAMQGNATAAAQIAGTPLPSGLRHADRATLRRVMGLGSAAAASDLAPVPAPSWRPVEVRAGS
jgi:Flp pilus assembly protein TadD